MATSNGRSSEPSMNVLEGLERIAERRAEIETVKAVYGPDAELRDFLLKLLDDMEEALCCTGEGSRSVRHGWNVLAHFESFGREGDDGEGDGGSK